MTDIDCDHVLGPNRMTSELRATLFGCVIGVMMEYNMSLKDMKRLWSAKNIEQGYKLTLEHEAKRKLQEQTNASGQV